jgi:hypothetical protein
MTTTTTITRERADLLETLVAHRLFLRQTAEGLTDDQARLRSTASELTIGGLIKHVAAVEKGWAEFMIDGGGIGGSPDIDWSNPAPEAIEEYRSGFQLLESETLASVLHDYEQVATETDRLVLELDLDRSFPLPPAPWFTPGATRSVRRAALHIIAETAQHAGHADIIRETIDGAKTMG